MADVQSFRLHISSDGEREEPRQETHEEKEERELRERAVTGRIMAIRSLISQTPPLAVLDDRSPKRSRS